MTTQTTCAWTLEDGTRCPEERNPWQHLCAEHQRQYARDRYRKLRAKQGATVYGKDEREAEEALMRQYNETYVAQRPEPLGPPPG